MLSNRNASLKLTCYMIPLTRNPGKITQCEQRADQWIPGVRDRQGANYIRKTKGNFRDGKILYPN